MAFCDWLSEKTGREVKLPTAPQWEYACLGNRESDFHFGSAEDDFSPWANMADRTFATFGVRGVDGKYFRIAGDADYIEAEGVSLADQRFDDGGCVTTPVGSYAPNSFGLCDMHGNAAEWTRTETTGEFLVKGGSYLDRPERCRASDNCRYPPWQRVHNAGFRVAIEERQE